MFSPEGNWTFQGFSCVFPLPTLLYINGNISAIMSSFGAWMELPMGPRHRVFPWPCDTDHSLPTTFPAVMVFRKWLCRCLIVVGLKELDLWNFWLSSAVTHWLWPVIWNRFLITECLVSSGSKSKCFHSLNYLQPCLEVEISRQQMTERNSWSSVMFWPGFLPLLLLWPVVHPLAGLEWCPRALDWGREIRNPILPSNHILLCVTVLRMCR